MESNCNVLNAETGGRDSQIARHAGLIVVRNREAEVGFNDCHCAQSSKYRPVNSKVDRGLRIYHSAAELVAVNDPGYICFPIRIERLNLSPRTQQYFLYVTVAEIRIRLEEKRDHTQIGRAHV